MDRRQFLDFDLSIEQLESRFRADVSSPAGEAQQHFDNPFPGPVRENWLLKLGHRRPTTMRGASPGDLDQAKEFGRQLFQAVFREQVNGRLRSSLDRAEREGKGLRIRLRLNRAGQLADLPWEFLYDSELSRFFSLYQNTPVIRFLEIPRPPRPIQVVLPLRILAASSTPTDYPRLPGLEQGYEVRVLEDALRAHRERGLVELVKLEGATVATLRAKLRSNPFHVLHFMGHGGFIGERGALVFEDENRKGRLVTGEDVAVFLQSSPSMGLIVLNACEGGRTAPNDPFGGVAQSLVRQGVPAVVAMQFEITDSAAVTFAQEFYGALADGLGIDESLAEARVSMYAGNSLEWGTPVLYLRTDETVLFEFQRTSSRTAQIEELITQARQSLEAKDWTSAVKSLQEALQLQPSHSEARSLLETASADLEKHEAVDRSLERAKTAFRTDDWDLAIQGITAALSLDPDNEQGAKLLGEAKRNSDARHLVIEARQKLCESRWSEATILLNNAADVAPDYPNLSKLTESARQGQEAQAKVHDLLKRAEGEIQARSWLAARDTLNSVLQLDECEVRAKDLLKQLEEEEATQIQELQEKLEDEIDRCRWESVIDTCQLILKIRASDEIASKSLLLAQSRLLRKRLLKIGAVIIAIIAACASVSSAWSRRWLSLIWNKWAASRGGLVAEYQLAQEYESGNLLKQNDRIAFVLYQKAADGSATDDEGRVAVNGAQYELARCYEAGMGTPRNLKAAESWYWKAYKGGDRASQYELGVLHELHVSSLENLTADESRSKAVRFFNIRPFLPAAEYQHARLTLEDYFRNRNEYTLRDGLYELEESARSGDMDANETLAGYYLKSELYTPSIDLAIQHLTMAANAGNVRAKYELGETLLRDIPTQKAGLRWIVNAASDGWPDALYKAGKAYNQGQIADYQFTPDPVQAQKWLDLASALGVGAQNGTRQPLNISQVRILLENHAKPDAIKRLVWKTKTSFDLDDSTASQLRTLGATKDLLITLYRIRSAIIPR
jgi:TPR repeat protein